MPKETFTGSLTPKAYVIIHDGTNIAVFAGGTSGHGKKPRKGNHLPGGTKDGDETPLEIVKREFIQETGLSETIITNLSAMPPNIPNVSFVVQPVGSVANLVNPFQAVPDKSGGKDSPFTSARAVSITDCLKPGFFQEEDFTGWFGEGIRQAAEQGLFVIPSDQ
jgi:hypothetical protein